MRLSLNRNVKQALTKEAAIGTPWRGNQDVGSGVIAMEVCVQVQGLVKWKGLACLENVKLSGVERKMLIRLPLNKSGLPLGHFLVLPRQLFCWVKRKWMRIRWTTFLLNTHGLNNEGGERTWQNVSRLLPNPKYLKNHTGRSSNPNTCPASPAPNCSCSRLIQWIVPV